MSGLASEKGLRLGIAGDDKKSVVTQSLYVLADRNCLHEIFANLIENAIKYTKNGGNVTISAAGTQDFVRFVVSDTGIGVPAADIEKIFQKFYRVDNSDTREVGGTGLGLYIVKKKVELLRGRIWAESVLGSGTSFIVELPRLAPAEVERQKLIFENNSAYAKIKEEREKI